MPSILLLDDEPHVLSALRRTLRTPLGPQVSIECFTDPHEALARLDQQAFELVVSDFRMPQMDGISFLRFARELQPHALRMVVSASTEIQAVMSAINEIEVFRYIVKPWTSSLLVEDMQAALAQAQADAEQRCLAEAQRASGATLGLAAAEARRLEALEPGLTQVQWGPNGEVLMPPLHSAA